MVLLGGEPSRHGDPAHPDFRVYDSAGVVAVTRIGRLVAVLGVDDPIVVDTPDVLLVCARGRAEDVRKLVDAVARRGDPGLR